MRTGTPQRPSARVGYAVNDAGRGVVYARLSEGGRARVLRAEFQLRARPNLDEGRATGFAALRAIAPLLRKHAREIDVLVDDPRLAEDLTQHRELPVELFLAYVGARCALNAFRSVGLLVASGPSDLAARARAEVSLRIAA